MVTAPSEPPPESEEVDASVAERENVQSQLKQAKQLFITTRLDEAKEILDVIEADAKKIGPVETQQLYELEVKIALAQKEWRAARKGAEGWLTSCGPDRVESCRAKAVAALNRVGAQQKTPEAAAAKTRVAQVKTADECLSRAEAAGRILDHP